MSIFSSYPAIGHDDDGKPDSTVLMYAGSHRFPTPTDDDWPVDLAVIPAWCVPGHADAEDSTDVGEYLRLTVTEDRDVILTDAAVLKLYHQLGNWLITPKRKAITDA